MKKQTVFITLLALLVSLVVSIRAESAAQLQGLNYLKDVTVEKADDGDLVIRLDLQDANVNVTRPVFFQKSAQVDLTNAYIKPAKRYFPTDDSRIPQVFVSQFDTKTVRVRLMLGENSHVNDKNLHIEKSEGSLTIRVGNNLPAAVNANPVKKESHPVIPVSDAKKTARKSEAADILDDLLKKVEDRKQGHIAESMSPDERARSAAKSLASVKAALGEEVSALPVQENLDKGTIAEGHLPSPLADKPMPAADVAGQTKPPDAGKKLKFLDSKDGEDSAAPDLMSTGMKMFSMLAVVLGLMFFILYILKNHVLKNGMFGTNEKLVKVLGTGMLAPRKTIALVEVAGEVLVLGISNEHIALLSTIREEEKIAQVRSASVAGRGGLLSLARTAGEGGGEKAVAGKTAEVFSKYIKQFSAGKPEPKHTAAGVAALIQKNIGKMRTA